MLQVGEAIREVCNEAVYCAMVRVHHFSFVGLATCYLLRCRTLRDSSLYNTRVPAYLITMTLIRWRRLPLREPTEDIVWSTRPWLPFRMPGVWLNLTGDDLHSTVVLTGAPLSEAVTVCRLAR